MTEIGYVYKMLSEDAGNIDKLLKVKTNDHGDIFVATTPGTIEKIATNCGLEKVHSIAADAIIYAATEKLNNASDENFLKYMEFHYSICETPDIMGATLHGLWIGRKV